MGALYTVKYICLETAINCVNEYNIYVFKITFQLAYIRKTITNSLKKIKF